MSSLNGKEILVIDDADDVRKLAAKVLENDGAHVSEANSVETGLELVEQSRPHLILLDLNFPGLSGFEFLSARRENPALMAVPVLVLSAVSDREGVTKAVSLGTTDYLIKPFRATQLLQKARKLLRVSSFLNIRFDPAQAPVVEITARGEIINYSEFGLRLESSVKFDKNDTLQIKSDLIDPLPLEKAIFRTANSPSVYVSLNRYANSVLFSGVGEDFTKKIKKAIGA